MPASNDHNRGSQGGRSVVSIRRDQAATPNQDAELEAFQKQVTDRFAQLASTGSDELLSLVWLRKLLDAFLTCQEDFRALLFTCRASLSRSHVDRLVSDYFERSVKALDLCNAVRDGIEQIRQWQKLVEIVLTSLDNKRSLGEGQFRRAKKALIDLALGMLDENDSKGCISSYKSFGRQSAADRSCSSLSNFRSLTWSVSRSWSASRQLQAIANNILLSRGNDIAVGNGVVSAVHTMNWILLFVMSALVASIPCQDRGLLPHFSIPRQFTWAASILLLHDKIYEESKKRDRRNTIGLLKEIHEMERCSRVVCDLADSVQFPLTNEKEVEVRQGVKELEQVFQVFKEGLDPLERQVRDVFNKIVRIRTEGIQFVGKAPHSE
ncbi:unnamed protein product [Rhodiola kirilowii]